MLKIGPSDLNILSKALWKIADEGRTFFHRKFVPGRNQCHFQGFYTIAESYCEFSLEEWYRVVYRIEVGWVWRPNFLRPKTTLEFWRANPSLPKCRVFHKRITSQRTCCWLSLTLTSRSVNSNGPDPPKPKNDYVYRSSLWRWFCFIVIQRVFSSIFALIESFRK